MDQSKDLSNSFSESTHYRGNYFHILFQIIEKINFSIWSAGSGRKPFPTPNGNIAKKPRKCVSKKGAASKGTDDEQNSTQNKNHSEISLDSEQNISSNGKNEKTIITGLTFFEKCGENVSNGETGFAVQNNIQTNASGIRYIFFLYFCPSPLFFINIYFS